jgi:hypothetical protein
MNTDHLYETETMAELCARQGRLGEAVSIYRQLLQGDVDATARKRIESRLTTLESTWQPLRENEVPPADVPIPTAPGVTVAVGDDQVTLAWSISPDTNPLAMDLLLIQRTATGIDAQKKLLPLPSAEGRLGLALPGAHSAVAAAGTVRAGRFVPLARSTRA